MTTEADAIANLATKAAAPNLIALELGQHYRLVTEHGVEHIDTDDLLPTPRRATGSVTLTDANSLITYVRKHGVAYDNPASETARAAGAESSPTGIYADYVSTSRVVAVLNGHTDGDTPGWGDHRAKLELALSPEWRHWASKDRQWLNQVAFAEHIEEGLAEIVEPPAADMLDVAQTLSARSKVDFRSQTILANGQRQFTYAETVEAKAGQAGTVAIPQRFTLGVAPYDHSPSYKLDARFQFRITEGALSVRYLLTRPHDVLRAAFDDIVGEVELGTGLRAFRGQPPQ